MRFFSRKQFLNAVLRASEAPPVVRNGAVQESSWFNQEERVLETAWITREVEIEVKDGETKKTVRLIAASTPDPDRYEDVIDQATIQFKRWEAALAPLLYIHDSGGGWTSPVGGCVVGCAQAGTIRIAEIPRPDLDPAAPISKKLAFVFMPEWDNHETNPLGQRIAHQWGKFIRTVSIGFRPKKVTLRRLLPKEHYAWQEKGEGLFFEDCEIYEVSVVPIPANPYAMELDEEGEIPLKAARASVQRATPAPSQERSWFDESKPT